MDASPVEEALDAVNAAANGCPPYAMAPPLPPRTGASPTGNRGPIVTSGDERIRVRKSLIFTQFILTTPLLI